MPRHRDKAAKGGKEEKPAKGSPAPAKGGKEPKEEPKAAATPEKQPKGGPHKGDSKAEIKGDSPAESPVPAAGAGAGAGASASRDSAEPAAAGSADSGDALTAPVEVLRAMVNDAEFGDVMVACEGSKAQFHAHEFIVAKRCPELLKNAKKQRKGGKLCDPKLDEHTIERLLIFVYTDNFPFHKNKLSDEDVIKLNAAANQLKLKRLGWLCSTQLQRTLTMKSIYAVLKVCVFAESPVLSFSCEATPLTHTPPNPPSST
jgi:BTB/POZ domain